jgi:hypothetical protein
MRLISIEMRRKGVTCRRWVVHAAVYDLNGREASEAELVLGALGNSFEQYIFCSSAGVYLKSSQMPHYEHDAGDPKSRHKVLAKTLHSHDRPDLEDNCSHSTGGLPAK